MKRLVVAAMAVASAVAVLPAESRAEWAVSVGVGVDYGHGPHGTYGPRGGGPAFRYGYDRGWREGSEEGYRDGRRSCEPRFRHGGEYRDADRGYRGWMGPRWDYAAGFREGYEAGYRRAYAASRPGGHGRRDHDGLWDERFPRPNDRDRDRGRSDDSYENDHR